MPLYNLHFLNNQSVSLELSISLGLKAHTTREKLSFPQHSVAFCLNIEAFDLLVTVEFSSHLMIKIRYNEYFMRNNCYRLYSF